jgi:tetratricopeptide (TPR) repeat protein
VIDGRRDHSFRAPRPDLSVKLGTPNACTDCHPNRSAKWAAETVVKWYGPNHNRGWHYGEALAAGQNARAGAEEQLTQTAQNTQLPAIIRATALTLLQRYLQLASRHLIENAMSDADPLVRRAAATALPAFDPQTRLLLGLPLLNDPIRAVRLEVAPILASVPPGYFTAEQRAIFDRVVAEYRESQRANADRAEAHLNLGILDAQLGNLQEAETAYRIAIRLQPSFIPAYINLADLCRAQNRESETEQVLRDALKMDANHGDVHHALGLSLVRQNRRREGVEELAHARQLRPDSPRYAYVYAVALHETGDGKRARQVLKNAHEKFPDDREILLALVEYHREAGEASAASYWARKLVALAPDDAEAQQLLEHLTRRP